MKRFIFRLLGFILIAIPSYIILLIVWNKIGYSKIKSNLNYRIAQGGHLFTRLREVENYGEIDVLVIGSSHAYRGFDPRVFQKHNLKMFNLGSSAQTPIQSEILLNRYLEVLKPKIVLFEVFPNTITTDDGVESTIDIISNSVRIDNETFKFVLNCRNIKVINTFLLAKYYELTNRSSHIFEERNKGNDTYVDGGFVQNMTTNVGECKNTNVSYLLNGNQLEAINRIEKLLAEKGIKLLYVSSPVTSIFYKLHPEYLTFYNYFKHKSNYFDYSQVDYLNENFHFIDCDHLNLEGATLFNEKLLTRELNLSKLLR